MDDARPPAAPPELSEDSRDQIYRAWARGIRPGTLASSYGLTENQVEAIVDDGLQREDAIDGSDPQRRLLELFVRAGALAEEYAMAAPKLKGSAQVAAIDGRVALAKFVFELQQESGLLPRQLGQFAAYRDTVQIATSISNLLDSWELPTAARTAVDRLLTDPAALWGGRDGA